MKIAIWSDYACPFCYIGEKRMEKALAEIPGGDKVEVEFKSFELDPTASGKVMSSTVDRFAMKYGLTKEGAAERIEAISAMGRGEGIDFRYASTRYTNTFDSLRLTKYAQEQDKPEIVEKLFDWLRARGCIFPADEEQRHRVNAAFHRFALVGADFIGVTVAFQYP